MSIYPTPASSNEVYIPIVATGCCSKEFFTVYPSQLKTIIQPDEFAESIGNINKTIPSGKVDAFICLAFILVMTVGLVLISSHNRSSVLGIGLISICISCTIINFRASRQMRDAIAIESNKYSTRLSMPCTWQFDIDKRWERSRGATRRVVTERVSDMILFR